MPAQILGSDETAKSSQHPSETEIFASPIRDKSNLPSGSGPNQALDANGLDPYWHSRSWRMLAKAEPKGWINWVLSTRCPVWTRKPSTSIRNPQVSCPNPPTDPPLAQNLLVLPITLDLATCNLQLAICDCDWRSGNLRSLRTIHSLTLLSADCVTRNRAPCTVRPQRRTVAAACLRIGARPDERNAADIGLTIAGLLFRPSLWPRQASIRFSTRRTAPTSRPITRTVLRMHARQPGSRRRLKK